MERDKRREQIADYIAPKQWLKSHNRFVREIDAMRLADYLYDLECQIDEAGRWKPLPKMGPGPHSPKRGLLDFDRK